MTRAIVALLLLAVIVRHRESRWLTVRWWRIALSDPGEDWSDQSAGDYGAIPIPPPSPALRWN